LIKKIFLIIILASTGCTDLYSISDSADFRTEDRIRIREAKKIFSECGNSIWKEWDNSPFSILLITNDNEYLINHNNPTEDFILTGYDTLIMSEIYHRRRQFSNNMLATFPAVNGIPTIVVGLPENTSCSSLDWIITILHEHFHQYQSSQSDYYQSVDSLDLSNGDKSGMWMLNYKFPYDGKIVSEQYSNLIRSAKKSFLSLDSPEFESNLRLYLAEREKFKSLLNKKDFDYFSFQIWQEGIARYTEIKVAEKIRSNYKPSFEITQLDDFLSLDSFYVKIINKLLSKADTQTLSENERNCFYTLGALEGLILDRVNPDWRDLYLKEKFYVDKYFKN
jgi:hypothetical protein